MCINLYNSSNCTITGNTVVGNGLEGNNLIVLNGCSECIIENNSVLTACYEGIGLYSSSNNQIRNNQIDGDGHAVYLQSAHGNVIFNNSISDGGSFGIKLSGSSGNVIYSNTVSDCWNGIEFEGGTGNTVFGNNFERNWNQVYGSFAGNSFNESSEGNYWSDYNGTDNNQDGIGDTLYIIGENNADCYPLMGVFHSFNVYDSLTGQSELEIVISNSTIGDVALSVVIISFPGPLCYLHLTGVAGQEGTTGFCRITFPNIMMNSSSYPIREGNYPNSSQLSSKILMSNGTHTTLYFTYVHPVPDLTIDVLPEFPSFLILQLFFLTTLFAVIVYRKRLVK
jgi:parallel beta-helix repeat protein